MATDMVATRDVMDGHAFSRALSAWFGTMAEISDGLHEAYLKQDWIELGYADWDAYVLGEFGEEWADWGRDAARGRIRVERTATIYFVQGIHGGPIKIGIAIQPIARLSHLQIGSPVPLRILATVKHKRRSDERALHERFAACHSHGEWFHPTPELLDFIASHALAVRP